MRLLILQDRYGTMPATKALPEPTAEATEDDPMAYRIRCPVCGDDFSQPQGLHGHLRFSHELSGDELDEVYERAQQQDHFDFVEGEADDAEGVGSEQEPEEQPEPEESVQERPDPSTEESAGPSRGFDWERRLARMDEIREALKGLDQSTTWFPGTLDIQTGRDEGAAEAMEALDEIEMEVRERLGMSDSDEELRERVDESLDQMEGLVRCREQRKTIKEKFSGEKAEQRVNRLDRKEAEIRAHVRSEWGVGKSAEQLDVSDPVTEIETGSESKD